MKSRSIFSLFVLTFLLLACQLPVVEPLPTHRKLERTVRKVAEEYNMPSVAVSLRHQDIEHTVRYHHPEAAEQTRYGVGSTTKLLSAVVVFKHIEEGRLRLDDPITEFIMAPMAIDGLQEVEVGQLLNHTSGLSDYSQHPDWITKVISGDPPISFAEKIALVSDQRAGVGSFAYSNTNYLFLEQILEAIAGKPFQIVFDEFYADLGLSDIRMEIPGPDAESFFAQTAEASQSSTAWNEHHGFAGGASADTQVLNQWLQALFEEGTILKESTLQKMMEWVAIEPQPIPIGEGQIRDYGFGLMRLSYAGKDYLGHYGGTLQYQSFVFHNVEEQVSVSLTTNCSGQHYNNAFFQALVPQVLDLL